MGFSLAIFIEELEEILATSSIFTVVARIKECVARNKKYARECGNL